MMKWNNFYILGLLALAVSIPGCSRGVVETVPHFVKKTLNLPNVRYAGVRSSAYGVKPFPGPIGWHRAIGSMQERFKDSTPFAVWIVGPIARPRHCRLEFPSSIQSAAYNNIVFLEQDKHEPYLDYFDKNGIKVFLQVEPGDADVPTLIDLVLNRYKHHPCVIGFGIDVEWYKSAEKPEWGTRVDDIPAKLWEERVKSHNPGYRLFLKHWDRRWMPPRYRGNIIFVNDSQMLKNVDAMKKEFVPYWADYFKPNAVFFQVGYPSDRKWWSKLNDPPSDIAAAIAGGISQEFGITWVDFSMKEVLPVSQVEWRAVHLLNYNNDDALKKLGKKIPRIAQTGVNVVILEVDYSFEFKSHPELRAGKDVITKKGAEAFSRVCKRSGIRLIVEFQCFGHQSWEKTTYPLLIQYPEFDLTPGAFPNNEGIYCREWDPLNPRVNEIAFELMDELIDAFRVDAVHVGMDEVFLIGHPLSPSTKGKNPAGIYAKAVNDIYNHLVKKRGVEMLMWGDRLIDGTRYPYGEWESSLNGTAAAVDQIPRDIIICDWHYEVREDYPSIPMFLEKGFRVLPTGWRDVEAIQRLIRYSQQLQHFNVLGFLFTNWGEDKGNILHYLPFKQSLKFLLSR